MELIIGIIIIAGLGYVLWTANRPKPTVQETAAPAPYKVEAPAQESTPVAEPAKEVISETASKPARATKAPAAKKPAAKKVAKPKQAAKKPAPAKKPAKPKK
jgi:hypothetical protein